MKSLLRHLIVGLSLVAAAGLVTDDAFAQKKGKGKKGGGKKGKGKKGAVAEETYQGAYGMAGCGLGSLVIKEDTMVMQFLASTTNGTSGSQSFGITTGSLNCADGGKEAAMIEQEVFVTVNLASLSKDAARGSGDYLKAFAEVLGCSPQFGAFADLSRDRHDELFRDATPASVVTKYHDMVRGDARLMSSCERAQFSS